MDFLRGIFTGKEKRAPEYQGPLLRGKIMNEVTSIPRDSSDANDNKIERAEAEPRKQKIEISEYIKVLRGEAEGQKKPFDSFTLAGEWDGQEEKTNRFGATESMIYLAEGITDNPDADEATNFIEDVVSQTVQKWGVRKEERPFTPKDRFGKVIDDHSEKFKNTTSYLRDFFRQLVESMKKKKTSGLSKLMIARIVSFEKKQYVVAANIGNSQTYLVSNDGSIDRLFKPEEQRIGSVGAFQQADLYRPLTSYRELSNDVKGLLLVSGSITSVQNYERIIQKSINEQISNGTADSSLLTEPIVREISDSVARMSPSTKNRPEYSAIFLPVQNDQSEQLAVRMNGSEVQPTVVAKTNLPSTQSESADRLSALDPYILEFLKPESITTPTLLVVKLREIENFDLGTRVDGVIPEENRRSVSKVLEVLAPQAIKISSEDPQLIGAILNLNFAEKNRKQIEDIVAQLLGIGSLTRNYSLRATAVRVFTDAVLNIRSMNGKSP